MSRSNDLRLAPAERAPTRSLAAALCALALLLVGAEDQALAKRKRGPVKEPDLKILSVTLSPLPYSPKDGSLDLAVRVQLPRDLAGAPVLEVSSLISSPSMRSMRFLSRRQPVGPAAPTDRQAAPQSADPRPDGDATAGLIEVTLTWDGTDQTKQVVGQGHYHYEVRAKLLASDDNGVRTQMVAWPKRGLLEVK
jgi:hypothetical protein